MVSYMKYHHGCEGWKTKSPQWCVFILSYLITNWGKYLSQPFGYCGLGNQSMAKIGKTYANKIWKHLTMFHQWSEHWNWLHQKGRLQLAAVAATSALGSMLHGWMGPRQSLFSLAESVACGSALGVLEDLNSIIKPVVSLANRSKIILMTAFMLHEVFCIILPSMDCCDALRQQLLPTETQT